LRTGADAVEDNQASSRVYSLGTKSLFYFSKDKRGLLQGEPEKRMWPVEKKVQTTTSSSVREKA